MSEEVFSIAEKHPPRDFLTISTNSGLKTTSHTFLLGKTRILVKKLTLIMLS